MCFSWLYYFLYLYSQEMELGPDFPQYTDFHDKTESVGEVIKIIYLDESINTIIYLVYTLYCYMYSTFGIV